MRRIIGIVLLSFALLQLGFRGAQRVRSDFPLWDFASVYASSRTFLLGHDPYNTPRVLQTWRDERVLADRDISIWTIVYPPCSLISVAPFAMMPAVAAMSTWLIVMAVLLVLQFLALCDLATIKWRDPRALILAGGALASAPLQFGILSGQLSLPTISLCTIAFWCVAHHREKLAGVLLGLACAIKPQLGGPFLAYYFLRRRREVSDYGMLVFGAICLLSLTAMDFRHIDWINGWSRNMADTARVGGVNDYSVAGKFRDEIIDLKMLVSTLPHDTFVMRIAVEMIVVALLCWFVKSFAQLRKRTGRVELLAISCVSALIMLPIYHRVYDATLLTVALAWALAELDGKWKRLARAVLLPMCAMLIPFDLMQSIGYRIPRVAAIANSWWWQSFIAPHFALGLIGVTVVLIWAMSRQAQFQEQIGSADFNVELPERTIAEPVRANNDHVISR